MAYLSSTTTSPNVPALTTQGVYGHSPSGDLPTSRTWVYRSTHISSDIEATGFITDGDKLGMKVGDILQHMGSTTFVITSHAVVSVTASSAAELGVGTTIGLGS